MKKPIVYLLITIFLTFIESIQADTDDFERVTVEFIEKHCVKCHGPEEEKGDVRLDTIGHNLDDLETALLWQDVVDMINLGDMPPEEEPRPEDQSLNLFLTIIQGEINRAAEQSVAGKGIQIRRLSHSAMDNTARDLVGVATALSKDLPEDTEVDGFLNMAETMELSTETLSQIQINAQSLSGFAMTPKKDLRKQRVYLINKIDGGRHVVEVDGFKATFSNRSPNVHGIWPKNFVIPFPGTYNIIIDTFAKDNRDEFPKNVLIKTNGNRNLSEPISDGQLLEVVLMASRPDQTQNKKSNNKRKNIRLIPHQTARTVGRFYIGRQPARYTVPVELEKGDMVNIVYATVDRHTNPPRAIYKGKEKRIGEALYVSRIEVDGPVQQHWPSTTYRKLVKNSKQQLTDKIARKRIKSFLGRAFRRPPQDSVVNRYFSLYKENLEEHKVAGAMRLVLEAALISPRFLMNVDYGNNDNYALANRLSYFIWNSMPDDELFKLAKSGSIRDPKILEQQVMRMLLDTKALRFSKDFTAQWLGIKDLGKMVPDRRRFPKYNKALESAMKEETEWFFRLMIENNLPIKNFVDSEFAILNELLADHYGFEGIKGAKMRIVTLPQNTPRGGLLSQASILTVTSNGTRTSPVVRGIWVLEKLLGSPPNPPPPDVEPLEPDVRGAKTVRDMLAKHREVDTCNECHRSIDPWGFAMENFDPIGAWRRSYGGYKTKDKNGDRVRVPRVKVDSTTKMANGTKILGFNDMKRYLAKKDKRIALAITEKLMAYAIGHQAGPKERLAVEKIVSANEKNDFPLANLVLGVVLSEPFANSQSHSVSANIQR